MSFWSSKLKHSLSAKLIALFIVIAVLLLLLVGGSLRMGFKHHFENNVRSHLVQYLKYVREDIGIPADYKKAQQLANSLNIEITIIDPNGVWSSTGRLLDKNDFEIEHRHLIEGVEFAQAEIEEEDFFMMRVNDTSMLFNIPNIRQDKMPLKTIVPLLILLVILFVLYHATRYLFAPILNIQNGVRRIGSGELEHRIDVKRGDELGVLASDVNVMAQDIQKMLDAKRQLLLAVSHELRSPLTRVNVATEMLKEQALKQQIKLDIQEMENLIEEILETERLTTRHQVLDKNDHELNALIKSLIASYFKDDAIKLHLPKELIHIKVDAARIKLLLKNLLENAVRYTPEEASAVELHAYKENQQLIILIKNYGEGIAAEHLPYLMEPFYRVDPARQRETGGYGLGLYLCKIIAEAHKGSLHISSVPGQQTEVKIVLPV